MERVIDAGANRMHKHRVREKVPIRSTYQSLYAYIELRTLYRSRPDPAKAKAASLRGA